MCGNVRQPGNQYESGVKQTFLPRFWLDIGLSQRLTGQTENQAELPLSNMP